MQTTKLENTIRIKVEIKNNPALTRKKNKHFVSLITGYLRFFMTSRYVAGSPPHVHLYKWHVDINILLRNIMGCSLKIINSRKYISVYKYSPKYKYNCIQQIIKYEKPKASILNILLNDQALK